jgi:hypothetical protein
VAATVRAGDTNAGVTLAAWLRAGERTGATGDATAVQAPATPTTTAMSDAARKRRFANIIALRLSPVHDDAARRSHGRAKTA